MNTPVANQPDQRHAREERTIRAMIAIYCRGNHAAAGGSDSAAAFCAECRELADYAARRLARCPFGEEKPTCARCPIHCYRPGMRKRVREVMRYAGPRMLVRHPVLAVRHWLDAMRKGDCDGEAEDRRDR